MKRSYTQLLNLFLWFCLVLVSLSGQSSAFQTGVHWKDSDSSARSHDFKTGFGSATTGSITELLSRYIGTLRGLSSEEPKNSTSQLSANISQVSSGLLGADPNLERQIGENVWEFNHRLEIQRVARRLEGQGLAIGTLNTITGRITLDPRVVGREGVSVAALNDFANHPERDRNGDGYVDTTIDRQLQTLIAQNWREVGRPIDVAAAVAGTALTPFHAIANALPGGDTL